MLFTIHPSSPIPIFEQIVNQVIFGIASGAVEVGELIPSVRELGVQLSVHPNTVAKAFQELERKAVITARRGKGMEVTPEAPELCREYRQEEVRKRIREALREASTSGLSPDELRALVEEELFRVNGRRRV
jgi:GntR family transcriptional regulator